MNEQWAISTCMQYEQGRVGKLTPSTYMLSWILNILVVHARRDKPCSIDAKAIRSFTELSWEQAIKGTFDEPGSHLLRQEV